MSHDTDEDCPYPPDWLPPNQRRSDDDTEAKIDGRPIRSLRSGCPDELADWRHAPDYPEAWRR